MSQLKRGLKGPEGHSTVGPAAAVGDVTMMAERTARVLPSVADVVAWLDAEVRPGYLLRRQRGPSGVRIGGFPDLPDGVEWPRRKGLPLHFLMQIELDALPHSSIRHFLPRQGRL